MLECPGNGRDGQNQCCQTRQRQQGEETAERPVDDDRIGAGQEYRIGQGADLQSRNDGQSFPSHAPIGIYIGELVQKEQVIDEKERNQRDQEGLPGIVPCKNEIGAQHHTRSETQSWNDEADYRIMHRKKAVGHDDQQPGDSDGKNARTAGQREIQADACSHEQGKHGEKERPAR